MRRRHLTATVLGLVVGLLAVYALCSHGPCASGSDCPEELGTGQRADVALAVSATVPVTDAALGRTAAGPGADPAVAAAGPEMQTAQHEGHGGGGDEPVPGAMLAMVCLAALAVALALLWPALPRRHGFLRLPRPISSRSRPTFPSWAAAGPPVVWQFSVIRC